MGNTRYYQSYNSNKQCSALTGEFELKRLFLLILTLSLVGCPAQISKSLASWDGHNVNELLASWGPPTQTFSDGQGGQVFVYTQTRAWTQPGTASTTFSASTYGNYTYGQATTIYQPAYIRGYTAYRMFWIDSTGTIYSWSWRGL